MFDAADHNCDATDEGYDPKNGIASPVKSIARPQSITNGDRCFSDDTIFACHPRDDAERTTVRQQPQ